MTPVNESYCDIMQDRNGAVLFTNLIPVIGSHVHNIQLYTSLHDGRTVRGAEHWELPAVDAPSPLLPIQSSSVYLGSSRLGRLQRQEM